MRSLITAMLAGAIVATGSIVYAASDDYASYRLEDRDVSAAARLRAEEMNLAWEASHPQTKGARRLVIMERQQEVDDAIDALQSGRSVDPATIDAMINAPLIGPGLTPTP